jgi:hypothetical protein
MRYRLTGWPTEPMEKSKLTEAQMQAWAATRVRMLLARLIVLVLQGKML